MSASQVNYASIFGIHSVGAAVMFISAYAPCVILLTIKSFRTLNYVFFTLTLFCGIRLAGFIIRAFMAGSESFGRDLRLYIADQVLFGAGFFSLLQSAYTLVLDRELVSNANLPRGPISSLTRNKWLFQLLLTAGVVMAIVGSIKGSSAESSRNPNHTLPLGSTVIFLVLTVLQAYRTLLLTIAEREHSAYTGLGSRVKATHLNLALCTISILLLIREGFSLASVVHQRIATIEGLWYPLLALPEVLVVFLHATPGLVPSRSQLVQGRSDSNSIALVEHNSPHSP